MQETMDIDQELLKKAAQILGEKEKSRLIQMALEALIERENARNLARLGGSQPELRHVPRRRL
ncbi:type II toxin-antitoxin system VapB family antitoxin [Desulfonatronovibrio magnus]|uniref:type II toxin-antitoxin system VapB family antitoxin n=1 Tax=Desulfonatronovibrio magnus TaxID=698827 RepID=UPI0005EBA733|nr:type II toxin-antitoxin system VapB family antitoxin [Desulfonatronovibrio magnus]